MDVNNLVQERVGFGIARPYSQQYLYFSSFDSPRNRAVLFERYINVTSIVLLFLYFRKKSLLREDVMQLQNFLVSERADITVIKRARAHFKYWWKRSGGVNIINPFMQRVGIVLRQDTTLYLYKDTLDNLGEVIGYSSHSKRVLASVCEPIYFLPGEDIMREMRIVRYVYIVHRGRVIITRNDKILAILTKGAIFGQLSGGTKERTVKVTARTDDFADILAIPHTQFQYVFSEKVKAKIAELAVNDYIPMRNIKAENPYNTIQYLTRGIPTVYLPKTRMPRSIKSCPLYAMWLQTAWLAAPIAATVSSCMLLVKAPLEVAIFFTVFAVISDTIHYVHIIIEFFFSVHLQVQGDHCLQMKGKRRKLKQWWLYVEILSFLMLIHIPLTGLNLFHCTRVLRLTYFYDYNKHFCRSFRKIYKPLLLNVCCVLLCILFMVISRLKFECEEVITEVNHLPKEVFDMIIDGDEYVHAVERTQGNFLPELTMEAPECLREDIMCTLYYHHLILSQPFRQLRVPEYFLRQVATLFHRHVIFAGVDIVQQGDITPDLFFIHEGEVEKYYKDRNGDKRVVTILTTNGYFGFVASMFPNTPYVYAYATHTVVDLVYLKYADWKNILNVYPDINATVEELAFQLRKEMFDKNG